jgi:alkenylglycerophosphocholine/alkenylglycerophosphoethanolamine hydrolase
VRLLAFVPYAVVSLIHLAALTVGAGWAGPTKVLLMPALLLAVLAHLPRTRPIVVLWLGLGILFAWCGDVLFGMPGGIGFLLALGGFMLAHLAHLALFRWPLRRRGLTWWAFAYLAWWLALILVLGPHLGALIVPVAIYGVVLGASAAFALGTNPVTAVGAFLFLVSDSILAFKLFWPGFELWQQDAIIMLFYCTGQGLIAFGAVRQGMRARTPAMVIPASATGS